MGKKSRKEYSEEFKTEIAREAQISGKTLEEIAKENDLAISTVYNWKEAYADDSYLDEEERLERENERIKKELERIQKEIAKKDLMVEIMKKNLNLTDDDLKNLRE